MQGATHKFYGIQIQFQGKKFKFMDSHNSHAKIAARHTLKACTKNGKHNKEELNLNAVGMSQFKQWPKEYKPNDAWRRL